ncbi:MAG: hypothetical protein KDC95_16620, partial [Planctomycetes bacterium]|nr:hypothetical protein [Planctomycetota bacterium]
EWVGDSPAGVECSQDGKSLFVTLSTWSAIGVFDSTTLREAVPGFGRIELVDDWTKPVQGLREPRAVQRVGDKLFVLGFGGGHSFFHDFDLWGVDLKTGQLSSLGGLGTQKPSLRADSRGRLWALGGDAQNALRGQAAVAAAPTGFVKAQLHRIDNPGTTQVQVATRDLHRDATGAVVAKSRALGLPYDLAIYEPRQDVFKVYVAAFGSDRIGVVDARDADASKWTITTISVPLRAGTRSQMAGPRGIALKPANPADPKDPGARLFVLDKLDATIVAIDPETDKVVALTPLAHDPVPDYVRRGQRFLYSTDLSGTGFVSCASCHLDGRNDGLAWDLSDATAPKALDAKLLDGVTDGSVRGATSYPATKGFMVTQSLQGLVQGEVAPPSGKFFSTVPHHWRGDQDFLAFNGAYVDLQGMPNLGGSNEPKRGISKLSMREFEEFTHSIHYPPNPEQPKDRRHSGTFGDPDRQDGSLGARGLKLFHTEPVADASRVNEPALAGRSCVQCHTLPDGSNHHITRTGITNNQPIETATLRGLKQKEGVLEKTATSPGKVTIGEFGTEHSGSLRSISDFNTFVFGHEFQGRQDLLDAITTFVRELDHGVAPIVGVSFTIDATVAKHGAIAAAFDYLERQVDEGNAGLTARLYVRGATSIEVGLWFDPTRGRWIEEASGSVVPRAAMLAKLQGAADRLFVESVPLGDDRRLASLRGQARTTSGAAPSALRLEPMRPMVAWRDIPRLTKNWVPGTQQDPMSFFWDGAWSDTKQPVPTPPTLRELRTLQYGLIQDGKLAIRMRHEAPRRFRISGRDIRPGARLVLFFTDDATLPPPHAQFDKMSVLDMPIYATSETSSAGHAIFETAVEAAPKLAYALLLGGPAAPGVRETFARTLQEPPSKGSFYPATWNRYLVFVVNEDGTFASGGWQALTFDG